MSNYVTRKEIATLLEVSVDVIRKNERRWKLEDCRANLNARLVRYFRGKTMAKLRLLKLID